MAKVIINHSEKDAVYNVYLDKENGLCKNAYFSTLTKAYRYAVNLCCAFGLDEHSDIVNNVI